MSQEKTEKATPRRREKARDEGQVAKSKELSSAITLFSIMLFMNFMMGSAFAQLRELVESALFFKNGIQINDENIISILAEYFLVLIKVSGPFLLIAAILGVAGSYVQVGSYFSVKPLKPKLSGLNPISGFKRFFSMRSLVELIKSLLKITVLSLTAYLVVKGQWSQFFDLPFMNLEIAAGIYGRVLFKVGIISSIIMLVLGISDFIYQKYEFEKSIKMSKQEIKQEHKDIEGDPQIIGKRRERMRQMAMQRMIQAVPQADVIITNPTHIAVAIKYDSETMEAPVVLAMGEDKAAGRIREVAKEHKIEIVENKPLARALYETAEIGEIIPVDLYQAVAEVLAFVYKLQNRKF